MSMETLEHQETQSPGIFQEDDSVAAFFIQKHDQCLSFEHVRETSLSGLTLKLGYGAEANSEWTLSCVVGEWRTTVQATVVSVAGDEDGGYWVTLQYNCNSEKERNDAMLFFMAMREYVDHYFEPVLEAC